jgi:hypothetical protein
MHTHCIPYSHPIHTLCTPYTHPMHTLYTPYTHPMHTLYTRLRSKLEVYMICSGSNHRIATAETLSCHTRCSLCGCIFWPGHLYPSFRRMFMPCSAIADSFRTDESVVPLLMEHPVCPL